MCRRSLKQIGLPHLTPSQASTCAARARDIFEKQAKERMSEGGKHKGPENLPDHKRSDARDAAGKAFGVSRTTVGKWVACGVIASVPMPRSKRRRIRLSEVERFTERLDDEAGE